MLALQDALTVVDVSEVHPAMVVGERPFVIAGGPLNVYVVVYMHRVYT